jgi:hypothetical protein
VLLLVNVVLHACRQLNKYTSDKIAGVGITSVAFSSTGKVEFRYFPTLSLLLVTPSIFDFKPLKLTVCRSCSLVTMITTVMYGIRRYVMRSKLVYIAALMIYVCFYQHGKLINYLSGHDNRVRSRNFTRTCLQSCIWKWL